MADHSVPPGWEAGPGMAHGGMLSAASTLFPNAPTPFIDLSTGINPHAYPLAPFPADCLTRLPDAADEHRLRAAAANAYGVQNAAMVVAAPGTQLLIGLLPSLLQGRVAILSPTYGGHEAAWRAAGRDIVLADDLDPLAEADIAVLCHPNNPDGRRFDPAALPALADRLAARGGRLVVDEAFADLEDQCSLAPYLPHPALIILRSFGKTYGLAGLRLGFLLSEPVFTERLRALFGPWAVSGPALAAGLQALPDAAWRSTMKASLDRDSARLDALTGFPLIGGTTLFRLYAVPDAHEVHIRLAAAGILVRRFAGHPTWLRFGIPAEHDWPRLTEALSMLESPQWGMPT